MSTSSEVASESFVGQLFTLHERIVRWKKWAAKHECEELKEGVWLGPVQAMLTKEDQRVVDRKAPQCDEEIGR